MEKYLETAAWSIPIMLVLATGLILALTRLRRDFRNSLLALIGIGLLILDQVVVTGVFHYLIEMQQFGLIPYVTEFHVLLDAIGVSFLLAAIFVRRPLQVLNRESTDDCE